MKITRIYDLPQKCWVSAWCFDFRSMLTYITSVPNGRENNLLIYFNINPHGKKILIIDAILKLSSTRAARVFNIRWGDMLASRGQKCWLESKEQTVLFCLSIPKHAFCYHRDKNTYLWHFMRWNFWPRRASDSGRRVEVAQCPSRTRLHNRFLPTSAPVYVLICRDFSFKK